MIKTLSFWKKNSGISAAEHMYQYREVHLAITYLAPLKRYVQNVRTEQPCFSLSSPYDGVSEIWWENLDAVKRTYESPEWKATAIPHSHITTDVSATKRVATGERVILDGPLTEKSSFVKAIIGIRRKDGVSLSDLQTYWLTEHAILLLKTMVTAPGLRRYSQNIALPENYEKSETSYQKEGVPVYDIVDELWFKDTSSMLRVAESADWRIQQDHALQYIESREGLVVEEFRAVWPES